MTWDDIRRIIGSESADAGSPQHDTVRRRLISEAEAISGIPLVIYAADFTDAGRAANSGPDIQINVGDKNGFLQALSDVPAGPLDVLLHSPGGSPTATDSVVKLLRARHGPIRSIIPDSAKSAATMLALSGDHILLGEAAELGPIDPQLHFAIDQRQVSAPARAVIDQFQRAAREIDQNPSLLRVWMPILRQYGPSFLQECHNAIELSEQLVSQWLQLYMFAGQEGAVERAKRVASWLANHNNFMDHSRAVWKEQLLDIEPSLKIRSISDEGDMFDSAISSLYWAIDVTFQETDAVKMIEHQEGSAYIKLLRSIPITLPVQTQQPDRMPRPGDSGQANRAERRRQSKRTKQK